VFAGVRRLSRPGNGRACRRERLVAFRSNRCVVTARERQSVLQAPRLVPVVSPAQSVRVLPVDKCVDSKSGRNAFMEWMLGGAHGTLPRRTNGEPMDQQKKFFRPTRWHRCNSSSTRSRPMKTPNRASNRTIGVLLPQNFALRSKGYSWVAIADMVSERGVPCPRRHFERVCVESGGDAVEKRAPRQTKRQRDSHGDTPRAEHLLALAPSQSQNTRRSAKQPRQPCRRSSAWQRPVQRSLRSALR
jgi:hypothetical protein